MIFYSFKSLLLFVVSIAYIQKQATSSPIQGSRNVALSPQEEQRDLAQRLQGLNNHFWKKGLLNKTNIVLTSGYHEVLSVIMHLTNANTPTKRELEEALGHSNLAPEIFIRTREYLKTLNVLSSTAFYLPTFYALPVKVQRNLRDMDIPFANSFEELNRYVITKSKGKFDLQREDFKESLPTLVNVISFQLAWQYKATYKPDVLYPFYSKDGTTMQIPMIVMNGEIFIYENDQYFVVRLPFRQELGYYKELRGIATYVICPKENNTLPEISRELIQKISKETHYFSEDVTVEMPGLQLRASSTLTKDEFSDLLKPNNNDFVFTVPDVQMKLRQEAYLCMDEKGFFGGSLSVSRSVYLSLPGPHKDFKVDRPFTVILASESYPDGTIEPIMIANVDHVSSEKIKCS